MQGGAANRRQDHLPSRHLKPLYWTVDRWATDRSQAKCSVLSQILYIIAKKKLKGRTILNKQSQFFESTVTEWQHEQSCEPFLPQTSSSLVERQLPVPEIPSSTPWDLFLQILCLCNGTHLLLFILMNLPPERWPLVNFEYGVVW